MNCLVCNDYETAYILNAVISLNMRLSGKITVQWGGIKRRDDGKYLLPLSAKMENTSSLIDRFTVEEYKDDWFPHDQQLYDDWFNGDGAPWRDV